MTIRSLAVLAVAFAPSSAFSDDLAPEVLMLARVKAHMRHEIVRIPNFTCVESLERYHKDAGSKTTMKPLDTLQLEVAHIGGRELFSWLGDRNFKEDNPSMFVGGGMIGNGIFVSHLRSLFVDDNGLFQYRGEVDLGGRRAACYSFQIPLRMSGYEIRIVGAGGTVGTKGLFWVDPQSLDLIRLEIHADEIPPTLPLVDAITTIDYARVRVGTTDVLMPQTSDMQLIEFSGEESRNVVEFTHCRSFNTESSISFTSADSPTPAASAERVPTPPDVQDTVPGGLLVSIFLTTPITEQATVGQMVEAKVSGDVRYKNQIVIPDGSVVRGRVRRLEHNSQPEDHFIVALEFSEIESGALLLRFFADLQSIDQAGQIEWFLSKSSGYYSNDLKFGGRSERTKTEQTRLFDLPGVGSFFVRGSRFTLPKGLRMTWKTRALSR
jgi:hypothetical protein